MTATTDVIPPPSPSDIEDVAFHVNCFGCGRQTLWSMAVQATLLCENCRPAAGWGTCACGTTFEHEDRHKRCPECRAARAKVKCAWCATDLRGAPVLVHVGDDLLCQVCAEADASLFVWLSEDGPMMPATP